MKTTTLSNNAYEYQKIEIEFSDMKIIEIDIKITFLYRNIASRL
jgi:hypothetical protein